VALHTPNAAIDAAANGEVDLAVSCLNIIPERLEKAEFSIPYQEDSLAFLSRKTNQNEILLLLRQLGSDSTIRDAIALLLGITALGAAVLWWIGKGFHHKDISQQRRSFTFFKGWMMLVVGSGIYKLGQAPPSMAIITLINIWRLVIISIFVGTAASLVFQDSQPVDLSEKEWPIRALREGVAVDGGTVSELWLKQQAEVLGAPSLERKIKPISGDEALITALEHRAVNNVMADTSRIQRMSRQINDQKAYRVSAQTFNPTPQAFVFGRGLSKAKRDQINLSISTMRFNGTLQPILKRWNGA
jgi:ABC-type amino acid transport substrate-binding protein